MAHASSTTLRKMSTRLQTVGAAYIFAIVSILAEAIVAIILIMVSGGLLLPEFIEGAMAMALVVLIIAYVLSFIVLFVLSKILVYVIRMFVSIFLVWISLGYILYSAYQTQSVAIQSSALVSALLFIIITIIFYVSGWVRKKVLMMVSEHKVAIERIEDLIGRISSGLSREDSVQLTKFIGSAKRSWSTFVKDVLAERSDISRVFYKSLLVTLAFFLASWTISSGQITNMIVDYGVWILGLLVLFTLVAIIVDSIHAEKLRRQVIRSV
ncbi:MAG: hypothetical protein Q6363_000510 [Candidatus Njordarchaeota archaeon]